MSFQIISGLTAKPKPPICLLARPTTYFSLQKQKWILVSDFFNFSNKKIKWVSYPAASTRNSAETFSFIRKEKKRNPKELFLLIFPVNANQTNIYNIVSYIRRRNLKFLKPNFLLRGDLVIQRWQSFKTVCCFSKCLGRRRRKKSFKNSSCFIFSQLISDAVCVFSC